MAYIGKSPTGTGVRSRYYFTATAGATSLSGADDNSNTLVFSDGNYVDVSLNGIALVAGTDYNTSTANTIAGLSALSASDIVEVVVYDIFTVADTVSAKDGGTFSGGVTMGGALTATAGASSNAVSLQSANFKMTDLSSNAFYRTDTFTPVWSSAGATDVTQSITTGTYGAQFGQYVRIGDLVSYTGYLQSPSSWSYTNGGATGQALYIYGLPFKGASSNGNSEQWGGSVNFHSTMDWQAGISIQAMVRNDEKFIRLFYMGASSSGNVVTDHVDLANSFIFFSGSYRTEEA